jgi:DNA-binding NarL/FixJ family response regulator
MQERHDHQCEIAQVLYVTPKTVEGHLLARSTKLGIAGRTEPPCGLGEEKTRVPTP